MPAQLTQERSRETRDRLLRAAVDLLAEGGARAVTHRAVAAKAGVAPASTTYYFRSIQELTDQALTQHVQERAAELRAIVEAAVSAGASPLAVSEQVAISLAERAEQAVVAQFEIYLEAWRNPALRAPVAEALDEFEALAAAALAALGVARPEVHAPAFVAAVDGFALHRLARPRPPADEQAALRATLRALFIATVMDDDERARWDERLSRPPG